MAHFAALKMRYITSMINGCKHGISEETSNPKLLAMSGSRAFSSLFLPVRTTKPRGQKWNTFLYNHTDHIWACDTSINHRLDFPLAFRLLLYPADAWIT